MKTIKNLNLRGKRVLLRCDFNVPLGEEGIILDDFRIKQSIKTIEYLAKKEAKVILMSHLGRPKGEVLEELRLSPIQKRLMECLNLSVVKAADCIGSEIEEWTKQMKPGEVLLLENLRFHKEEEAGDLDFAKELAKLGDIYINDAFGASHRSHASITGLPKFLPAFAGFLLEEEINSLSKISNNPDKPLVVIVGGAKIETKTGVINKMSEKADFVLVGELIAKAMKEQNIEMKYPQKIVEPISENEGKDIGPKTVDLFKEKISLAKSIFWNGPLGRIEEEEFAKGTKEIAKAIVQSQAFSVVGGGETVEFVNKIGLIEKFGHVSTGGGAMLEFLSGDKLPGIEALL